MVTGLSNCSAIEYTGLAASPLLIYAVRTALDAFFNYRLASSQSYLNYLNKQRDDAISKLKEATKYNSTQQLLDKYGGSTPTKSPQQKTNLQQSTPTKKQQSAPVKRTGLPPPPTANIPGRQLPPAFQPMTPPQGAPQFQSLPQQQPQREPQADFAPNAFTAPTPRDQPAYASSGPRWYDRILDIVLGDDETLPKNRIVLLCRKCRLVNGQAPPGTRSLEELGSWRCKECHALNGQDSEAKAMIREIAGESTVTEGAKEMQEVHGAEKLAQDQVAEEHDVEDDEESEEEKTVSTPATSTRSKVRQRKK